MKPGTIPQGGKIDPSDGPALRTYYESLRGMMESVRSSWDGQYGQLRAFFAPRNARVDPSDANMGNRRDYEIINETGLLALRVLCSGMLTGMSNQTRKWFHIKTEDKALDANKEVRAWCEAVEDILRAVLLKSNFYQTLLEMYEAEGLYGTGCFAILEDAITDIRCHSFPNQSYYLAIDDTRRVDLILRKIEMTARQIVEQFGRENCSTAVLAQYDSNAGGVQETAMSVVHVIHKGTYYGDQASKDMPPWVSVYYEMGSFNEERGILRRSGFHECPVIAGRWRTIGENIYGESPAMDVLGSTMSLQRWEERLAQASERQWDPPMVASTEVDARKATTLPGDITFISGKDSKSAFTPAYQIDFKLETGIQMLQRLEGRIKDGMFQSLFQMFSESDRREITAEEIRAKQAEKMQILGPVVERNVDEVLAPSIKRVLSILQRIPGRLPPMPKVMRTKHPSGDDSNAPMALEFESILAAAQKMVELNNINQVMQFAGQEAALDQGIMDNLDLDAVMREYADRAGISSSLVRTPAAVAKLRADKARQAQQQAAADNAQKLAQAAQTASQTPAGGGNLLQKVAPGLAGGDEG